MDQSYWSDPEVIKLSERFVCARLATYEDATEGKFLKSLYRGRTGELENTVFVILAPDGKTRLSKSGRSPQMVFGGSVGWESSILALEMHAISQKYPAKSKISGLPPLPTCKDLRRSLNVASCDRQLLVVADRVSEAVLNKLRVLAWKEPFRGRLAWGLTKSAKEAREIGLPAKKPGISIISPGEFGLTSSVISFIPESTFDQKIESDLATALQSSRISEKNYRRHVLKGRRLNKKWDTEIEVTDPMIPPR